MKNIFLFCLALVSASLQAKSIQWDGREFEMVNVNAEVVNFRGEQIMKKEFSLFSTVVCLSLIILTFLCVLTLS